MIKALDYKKEFRDLYLPKQTPTLIDVPTMRFCMIDGIGNPNEENGAYAAALEALYALTYTIKMSKKGSYAIDGYFDYFVPPLEGLWWFEDESSFDMAKPMDKDKFHFTSMIRQPEFVDQAVFKWAVSEIRRKKPQLDTSNIRFASWTEELCVQCMHIGSYDDEARSVDRIEQFISGNGYENAIGDALPDGTIRRHHEIYLSDPRRSAPEKLKTVIRHPVRRATND